MAARAFETQQRALNLPGPSSQLNPQRPIEMVELGKLRLARSNARQHSKKQTRQIADSIERFGFNNPLIVDDNLNIVAGHGRFAAARLLHLPTVPVIRLSHLSETELRAYRLADNKLAENAAWDPQLLAVELKDLQVLLPQLGLDLSATGFEPLELQSLIVDLGQHPNPPEKDLRPNRKSASVPDAQRRPAPARVNELAAAFANPYKVQISGQTWARGDWRETLTDPAPAMVQGSVGLCAHRTADGVINYINCQHPLELIAIAAVVYDQQKNLGVWVRNNTGWCPLYELVLIYRRASARPAAGE